ncbi:hypothetical protein BDN67DRAFT_973252 [Paxillus ammoniavirescens]|nr:hypothetical protein BDN67DRAFT_973252 [Paxillus ammoniavirescens]
MRVTKKPMAKRRSERRRARKLPQRSTPFSRAPSYKCPRFLALSVAHSKASDAKVLLHVVNAVCVGTRPCSDDQEH